MSEEDYSYPPSDPLQAEDWVSKHPKSAIAYGAGWLASGQGYGPQALEEWPECPGFDWDDGIPDWSELKCESGYEYRTVLLDGSYHTKILEQTEDGWEMVVHHQINPEPELFNEEGRLTGVMYLGEGACQVVYRRKETP